MGYEQLKSSAYCEHVYHKTAEIKMALDYQSSLVITDMGIMSLWQTIEPTFESIVGSILLKHTA